MLKIHLIFKKDYLTSSLTLLQWNSFTIIQGARMQGVAPIARLLFCLHIYYSYTTPKKVQNHVLYFIYLYQIVKNNIKSVSRLIIIEKLFCKRKALQTHQRSISKVKPSELSHQYCVCYILAFTMIRLLPILGLLFHFRCRWSLLSRSSK